MENLLLVVGPGNPHVGPNALELPWTVKAGLFGCGHTVAAHGRCRRVLQSPPRGLGGSVAILAQGGEEGSKVLQVQGC